MTDPILDAIEFANAPEHGGAGYTLRITLVSGAVLDNVGIQHRVDDFDVLVGYRLIGDGDGADLFVNPANIETVTVLW